MLNTKNDVEQFKNDLGSMNYTQSTLIDVIFESKAFNVTRALNCQQIEQAFRKKGYMCSRECIYSNLNTLLYELHAISVVIKKEEKRPYIYHYYIPMEENE